MATIRTSSGPLRPRRGRPPKFTAPSRHVTLTLPEAVIGALSAVDRDLSRAVVRLAQPMLAERPHPPAELAVWGRRAVIIVAPSRAFEERTGATLVPLPDGRALISFNRVTTIAELALLIQDALDDPALTAADRTLFEAVGDILRSSRRSTGVTLVQRNIIVLEATRTGLITPPRPASIKERFVKKHRRSVKKHRQALAIVALALAAASCSGKSPSAPAPLAEPTLTAPVALSPVDGEQLPTLRPTLTVQNGTSDRAGTRSYEFQISDRQDFSASTTSLITNYFVVVSRNGVAEGADGRTSFTPDQDLQPTTRFYWRARMVQGSTTSAWSAARRFNSKLMGFIRAGELYDPLIHGETVGERVGSTDFVPGKGIRLNEVTSHVKYLLPQTISDGEFSMDVEGLRANAPGNKTKVFGMQEGQDDFITNRYRVDIQYRGSAGVPPNCIQWRAMFGSEDEKVEPDTAVRFASVFLLEPSRSYYWKATWNDSGFRLQMLDGGMNGSRLYDHGVTDERVHYNPNPHYAYLGAPIGRSGDESASIPGTIYRSVWLGNRPRPASLGSALQ